MKNKLLLLVILSTMILPLVFAWDGTTHITTSDINITNIFVNGSFTPYTDNVVTGGSSSLRFLSLYAVMFYGDWNNTAHLNDSMKAYVDALNGTWSSSPDINESIATANTSMKTYVDNLNGTWSDTDTDTWWTLGSTLQNNTNEADVNITWLNETIDEILLGDYWFFTTYNITSGTATLDINETQQYDTYDGVGFQITEVTPGGLYMTMNTSNNITTSINKICIRYKSTGDDFELGMYDTPISGYENYLTLTESPDYTWLCADIRDSTDHIIDNKILIEINDTGSASIQHELYIDALYISSGYTPSIGNEVDPIWGTEKDNYYNITQIDSNNATLKSYIDAQDVIFNNSVSGSGTNCTGNQSCDTIAYLGTNVSFNFIDLPEITEPATPPADTLRLYTEDKNGFSTHKFLDETGLKGELTPYRTVVNVRGSTIAANRFVYITGNYQNVSTVNLAKADSISTMPSIGITVEAIANGSFGRVLPVGLLEDIDLNGLNVGDILYVSDLTAGTPKNTPPVTPNLTQEVGIVLSKNDSDIGDIQIISRALTGDEFGTINDFIVNGSIKSNDWTNATITESQISDLTSHTNLTSDDVLGFVGNWSGDRTSYWNTSNDLMTNSSINTTTEIISNFSYILSSAATTPWAVSNTTGVNLVYIYMDADWNPYFILKNGSETAKVLLHTAGDSYIVGDLAIGTTTPTTTLEVAGNITTSGYINHSVTDDYVRYVNDTIWERNNASGFYERRYDTLIISNSSGYYVTAP